ncbi:hypothetical protein D0T51_08440 [Parabacteroides sp. 52]|uniref:BF3164 family lipoprotein n=1 Tax=unclassified Parabacteroides TaxID=2649774 RepID=UPI0013D75711|nr:MULTISPECIES: BF3164 family lipoprotein [unclassified Parabacteroides]MDH6534743.1 hypothetical protein [Parabacteroides sp. PM5-20]NDV55749.1 hypothetical protein [Parabacteroides sp. 52]
MKKLFASILLLACLGACKEEKPVVTLERISLENLPADSLQLETLVRLPDKIAPEFHIVDDTLLVILYERDASYLRFFGTGERKIKKYSFRKPKERLPIDVDPRLKASLPFFHKATNIFYEYEIENGELRLDAFTRLRIAKQSPYVSVKVDKDLFAGIGEYRKGLWGLCNRKKKEIDFFGDYPIKQEYTSSAFLPLFRGDIAEKNKQLVYVSNTFGYISSYTYSPKKIEKQWERQVADFLVEEKVSRVVVDKMHTSGFQDVYMTEKYIYGLYNGYSKHSGWKANNSLIVFDRAGNALAHYQLADHMEQIAVDSQDKYLYASYNPFVNESYLVRFALPEIKGSEF